jgi:hypothetical protein
VKIHDNHDEDGSALDPIIKDLIEYRDRINAVVKEIKKFEIGGGVE